MATEAQGQQNGQSAIFGGLGVDDAQQMIEQSRVVVEQAVETAGDFIRERPIICLAGAIAIGYVIGKIVSR